MIINKTVTLNNSCNIDIPLSYEYDSNSNSIVLLAGYKYQIMYDNEKTIDNIDLIGNTRPIIPIIEEEAPS